MGSGVPLFGGRGMSGCRERQTVVSTVVRCCLRGVKWVLPPWEVDWLVPMGQATLRAVMAHQAENKQDTPASGKTNQHVHSSRPNRMRSKVQLCLHVSECHVCLLWSGRKRNGKRNWPPHEDNWTTGQLRTAKGTCEMKTLVVLYNLVRRYCTGRWRRKIEQSTRISAEVENTGRKR